VDLNIQIGRGIDALSPESSKNVFIGVGECAGCLFRQDNVKRPKTGR
jgi:hypothetical protein